MTFFVGLVLYLIFLAIYWFFVLSVLWHAREYSMPQDSSRWIIWSFLGAIIALNLISLALLFNLPLK